MSTISGELELLSDGIGTTSSSMLRVPAMRIGTKVIRNALMPDDLFSLLAIGGTYKLAFGCLLHRRWLLRIETGEDTYRCGLFLFLSGSIVHAALCSLLFGLLSTVVTASHEVQTGVAVMSGLFLFLRNLKI